MIYAAAVNRPQKSSDLPKANHEVIDSKPKIQTFPERQVQERIYIF